MKIKIFCGTNLKTLENTVNKFIRDKCVISIVQSQVARMCEVCTTITVLFEDGFCCDYLKTVLCPKDKINRPEKSNTFQK